MIDFDELEEPVNLESLTSAANEALSLKEEIASLEAELKILNANLEKIVSQKIPAAMHELGMKSFTLSNGQKITIRDIVSGSIEKSPNRDFAYNWVIENEGADLIKTHVGIDFGKNEHNRSLAFIEDCRTNYGISPTIKETIHPQTFCSFVREKIAERNEMLDNGEYVEDIPYKDLGLFVGKKAVFK